MKLLLLLCMKTQYTALRPNLSVQVSDSEQVNIEEFEKEIKEINQPIRKCSNRTVRVYVPTAGKNNEFIVGHFRSEKKVGK